MTPGEREYLTAIEALCMNHLRGEPEKGPPWWLIAIILEPILICAALALIAWGLR